jgi:quercetin dioxygenase-like cupin family protein
MSRSTLALVLLVLACVCLLAACAESSATPPAAAQSAGGEQAAPAATGADAAAASPDVFTVVVESERMRVMLATWQPSQRDNTHGHPRMVAYSLTDIAGVVRDSDGAPTPLLLKAGNVLVQDPVQSTSFENTSSAPARMLLVELRDGKPVGKLPDGSRDPQVASPDIFELVAFDSRVRVLRATWQPGQQDQLHGHSALVAYALTDITGQLTSEDGKTVKPVTIRAGSALLEGPVTGHTFKNLGTAPAQMLLVEARK